jgi:hypothetical protein
MNRASFSSLISKGGRTMDHGKGKKKAMKKKPMKKMAGKKKMMKKKKSSYA